MSENPEQNDNSFEDTSEWQSQFEALDIPSNIDPHLLAIWMQREQNAIERKKRKSVVPPRKYGRNLSRLFAAYIGIAIMCLSLILGVIQGHESTAILQTTCLAFLAYTVIGAFVGLIAERCVNDSVETLLRDIVNRSREAGKQSVEAEEQSAG